MDIASAVTPEVRVVFDVTVTQIEIVQAIRIPDDWSSEPEKPPI